MLRGAPVEKAKIRCICHRGLRGCVKQTGVGLIAQQPVPQIQITLVAAQIGAQTHARRKACEPCGCGMLQGTQIHSLPSRALSRGRMRSVGESQSGVPNTSDRPGPRPEPQASVIHDVNVFTPSTQHTQLTSQKLSGPLQRRCWSRRPRPRTKPTRSGGRRAAAAPVTPTSGARRQMSPRVGCRHDPSVAETLIILETSRHDQTCSEWLSGRPGDQRCAQSSMLMAPPCCRPANVKTFAGWSRQQSRTRNVDPCAGGGR